MLNISPCVVCGQQQSFTHGGKISRWFNQQFEKQLLGVSSD